MERPVKRVANQTTRRSPATTPESRENQMVSLAIDLAEKQLADGSASATVITHYLKIGTIREQLEKEKLIQENALLRAKSESIGSQAKTEQMYKEALDAMRTYSGQDLEDDEYEA